MYLPQKPLIKSLNIHGCKTMFSFVVYKGKLVLPKNCDVRFEKLTPEKSICVVKVLFKDVLF